MSGSSGKLSAQSSTSNLSQSFQLWLRFGTVCASVRKELEKKKAILLASVLSDMSLLCTISKGSLQASAIIW